MADDKNVCTGENGGLPDHLDEDDLIEIGKWQYKRSGNIMARLNSFRNDGLSGFCDVTLEVEGRHLPAHRCILAANSQFFYTMFNSGMRESSEKSLKLHSVAYPAMSSILDFFYTQEITLIEETLLDILDASCFLLLSPLMKACLEMVSSILSVNNCFSTKQLAAKYNAEEVYNEAENFINIHFLHLARTSEEFLELSSDELSGLLSSNVIRVEDEIQVLEAVFRWVKHDLLSRQHQLPKLLQSVRTHLIPEEVLKEQLEQESLLMADPVCKEHIEGHLHKHLSDNSGATAKAVTSQQRSSTKVHNVLVGVGIGECHRVFCYDVEDKETSILPNLPQVQAFPGLVAMNKEIYILGGESQKNIHYDPVNSMRTFSFEVAKSSTEKRAGWQKKSSFREVRRDAAVVTHKDKIYVLGGWMSGPIRTVECYDSSTESWLTVAPLNIPRSQLAAVSSDAHIYAVGGSTDQVVGTNTIEQFDPSRNSWRFLPVMRTRRVFANVVFLHSKVYVLGGYANVFEKISSCEVFDPVTCVWNEIAALPDTLSTNQSVMTLNNEIIAITGSQDSFCNAAWYNQHADVWEKVKNFDVYGNIAGYRLCCLQVKKFYLQDLPLASMLQGNHYWNTKQGGYFVDNNTAPVNANDLGLSLSDDNDDSDSEEDWFFL